MAARALSRVEEVSSKQWTFLKTRFIPLFLFMLVNFTYIYTEQKIGDIYEPTVIYPEKPKWMPCGLPEQNDPVIKVNNLSAYMVGSYIEHRGELPKMIRTIAVVDRSENTECHCLLCCNGQNISVNATRDIHSDHFGFEYGTADINCQLPKECTNVTHVAITSPLTKEGGSLQSIHVFQPVRNQEKKEEKDNFPYDFTVCISVMYEYDNVLEFVQAMEMFKILGVQKVAIYKTNCSSDIQKILDYYIKQDFVDLIPWTISRHIKVSRGWRKSDSSGELYYFGQLATLNDCVYRYMYQSRYVVLQDLDELILPMNLKNWKELLPELERKYSKIVGFEFENNYFPLSLRDSSPKYSPASWKKVKGVNILEHVIRISNDPGAFNNYIVIVNPRLVYKATHHGILQPVGSTVRVDPQIARMYHMRSIVSDVLKKRHQIRDTHVRDYAGSLMPAVSKALEEALGSY